MFLRTLNIVVAEWIKFSSEGLSPMLERKIHERLVFTNPDYELRHNRGEWIGGIPPQISCFRQKGRNYLLPRGFLDQFLEICKKVQQPYRLIDRRRSFDPLAIEFHGELKSYQQDAAEAVLNKDFATLAGGHKSGKTVIALYTIAQRRQPTLILIPKLELLEGWLTKIESFLQIPASEVGIFSGGSHQVGQYITIGHTGEMVRHWRKIWDRIGYLILDECQRCPPKVLTHLLPNFDTRYMLGLSNVAQRKDRISRLIYYYIGDMVYAISEKDAREGRGIINAHVVARQTEFDYPYSSRADYPPMLQALMHDEKRTRIIVEDIEAELHRGVSPIIVLSGSEEHSALLDVELKRQGMEVIIYNPPLLPQQTDEDEEDFDEALLPSCDEPELPPKPTVILVTPQTLVACFHRLRSKVIFLTVPLYFHRELANAIRELYRNGKAGNGEHRLKVYDYVDQRVGLLDNYFRMRSYNYGVHPDLLLNPQLN